MRRIILILTALVLGVVSVFYFSFQRPFAAFRNSASDVSIEKQNGAWRLFVDGKPYLVKGVCYSPVPVGKDYEYNFWGDASKPWREDAKLMKAMGANTVRFYRAGKHPSEVKRVLDDLYGRYGMRVLLGHYLGFWNWPPANYADPDFKDRIRAEVLDMVGLYKDHPAILIWVLGNENNYSFDRNVRRWSSPEIDALKDEDSKREARARLYYSFINDLAKEVKRIDPKHPVAMGVGETKSLQFAREVTPDVDVIGMISYRGPSFGNLFREVEQKIGKPVVMIEWGADSFNAFTRQPDEASQASFIKTQWEDIARNADPRKGVGNSLGGTLFEWNDEWWKGNENLPHTWQVHDEAGHWANTSYYFDAEVSEHLNMNEEWWGVVSLNPKKPKKAYEVLKSLWTQK